MKRLRDTHHAAAAAAPERPWQQTPLPPINPSRGGYQQRTDATKPPERSSEPQAQTKARMYAHEKPQVLTAGIASPGSLDVDKVLFNNTSSLLGAGASGLVREGTCAASYHEPNHHHTPPRPRPPHHHCCPRGRLAAPPPTVLLAGAPE